MVATYDPENGMPLTATSMWFGDNPFTASQPNLPPAELAKMYQPLSLEDKTTINAGSVTESTQRRPPILSPLAQPRELLAPVTHVNSLCINP